MSLRFRLRTFLIWATLICLGGVFVFEFRNARENVQQLERLGAKLHYSNGKLWLLGEWTPPFIRNSVRRPVGADIDSDIGSTKEILTRLDRIRTIEKLSLSLNSSSADRLLDLPRFPRLREFHLKSGGDVNLGFLEYSPRLEMLKLYCPEGCTDAFLKTIPSLPALRYFETNLSVDTIDGLGVLTKMPTLSELDLWNVSSSESLEKLPPVPTLQNCRIQCWD